MILSREKIKCVRESIPKGAQKLQTHVPEWLEQEVEGGMRRVQLVLEGRLAPDGSRILSIKS